MCYSGIILLSHSEYPQRAAKILWHVLSSLVLKATLKKIPIYPKLIIPGHCKWNFHAFQQPCALGRLQFYALFTQNIQIKAWENYLNSLAILLGWKGKSPCRTHKHVFWIPWDKNFSLNLDNNIFTDEELFQKGVLLAVCIWIYETIHDWLVLVLNIASVIYYTILFCISIAHFCWLYSHLYVLW